MADRCTTLPRAADEEGTDAGLDGQVREPDRALSVAPEALTDIDRSRLIALRPPATIEA